MNTHTYILGLIEIIKAQGQMIAELKEEVKKPVGGYGTFGKVAYSRIDTSKPLSEGPFRLPPILSSESLDELAKLIDTTKNP